MTPPAPPETAALPSEDQVRSLVRRVLLRTVGPDGVAQGPASGERPAGAAPARVVITEADLVSLPAGSQLPVPPGAVVTPLARQAARERRIELVPESAALAAEAKPPTGRAREHQAVTGPIPATNRTVALGADHGGFSLKEDLKSYLAELGFQVVDCGTHSTDAVDYADFAYAVASLVAQQRAWRGIVVDGAGIGSCMAANKVPGVRAALCHDHATAVNSREHNDANVLTLGGGLLGRNLARQIVKAWLETEFGGGRHARRVEKIMEIERRFLR